MQLLTIGQYFFQQNNVNNYTKFTWLMMEMQKSRPSQTPVVFQSFISQHDMDNITLFQLWVKFISSIIVAVGKK